MNHKEFISVIVETYSIELSNVTLQIWIEALQEYSFDVLQKTAAEIIKTLKFAPRLSEILEIAGRMQSRADEVDDPRKLYWLAMQSYGDALASRPVSNPKALSWLEKKLEVAVKGDQLCNNKSASVQLSIPGVLATADAENPPATCGSAGG